MFIPNALKVFTVTAVAAFALAACGGGDLNPASKSNEQGARAGVAKQVQAAPPIGSVRAGSEIKPSGSVPRSSEAKESPKGSVTIGPGVKSNGSDSTMKNAGAIREPMSTVVLEFSGLKPLANGYHYEGWAIVDGSPVSTGKFNVGVDGELMDLNGKVIAQAEFGVRMDLSKAAAVALTIEPPGDSDSMPSGVKYLAGDVSGGSVSLSVSHAAALGDDFAGASGAYILATPTDGADNNETSGIWYIDLSSGSPMPGLQLPTLPPSFEYEGWVIIDGTPVSTGKFSDVAAADSGNPYSGSQPGKPFPGEDFLRNAPAGMTFPIDLRGKAAAISIEPVPDDSPAPFALKPLIGGIPANAEPFTDYQLDNQAGGFPTGTAVIK